MRDLRKQQMDATERVLDAFCPCGRPRTAHGRYCQTCSKRVTRTGSPKASAKEKRAEILHRGLIEGLDAVTMATLMHYKLRHVQNVERLLRRRGVLGVPRLAQEEALEDGPEPEREDQPR